MCGVDAQIPVDARAAEGQKERRAMRKRVVTGLLAFIMCITAIFANETVYAAAAGNLSGGWEESAAGNLQPEAAKAEEEIESPANIETTENTEITETIENTEVAENTENTEITENTETAERPEPAEGTGFGEEAETTEAIETEPISETAQTTEVTETIGTEPTTEPIQTTEVEPITEATETEPITETTQTTELIEATETEPITETTEPIAEATEGQAPESELEEEGLAPKFVGTGVSPGSTYENAAALELEKDYTATTAVNTAGWYQFTLEKAGLVSFAFSHEKLVGPTSNVPAYSIVFHADNTRLNSGLYTLTSGAYDAEVTSPQVGLPAGTYRIKVTPVNSYAGRVAYGLRLSYQDAYCETEENNSAAAADELSLGKKITGSLYGAGDADYFKITVSEESDISLNLTHDRAADRETMNLYRVSFCDASEKTLYEMYSNGASTDVSSIDISASAGTYLVKVEGALGSVVDAYTGNYGLSVTAHAAGTREKENNDTMGAANAIASGVTYGGDLRNSGDVDYFLLTDKKDGYLSLDFSHTVVSGWETENVYKITVIRKGQTGAVYTGYVKGGETSWKSPNIGLAADSYYIAVEPAATLGSAVANGFLGSCYPADYKMTATWKNKSAWEKESNNAFTAANAIQSGKVCYGSIAFESDKDYYKITLKKNGFLQFKLSYKNAGTLESPYQISVCNKDGNTLYESGSMGMDSLYASGKVGLEKGTYYIVLSAGTALYTGDYQLTATAKAASDWETETNGDMASADALKVGKEKKGTLHNYFSDLDYYKFTLDKSTYVNISLTHRKINGTGRSWYVYLLKETGKRLNYRSSDHLYAYAGDAYTETKAIRLEKGTYYIVVRTATDNTYAVGEEYAVCVNRISAKKPTVSQVASAAYNKLKVTWKVMPGAVSYTIYRSTSKDGNYSQVKTISDGKTSSWVDRKVVTGKTYYYKIKAKVALEGGTVAESSYSAVKSGKAALGKTSLKAAALSQKGVKLTWSKVSGASGYVIYRSTEKNKNYSKIKTIAKGSVKTYTDKGGKLKRGTVYYYKIKAYRKVNGKNVYGGYSNTVSKKIK